MDHEQFFLKGKFPSLDPLELEMMGKEMDEKIKQAIFIVGSFKVPSEDKFQALFYQSQWDVVGPSLCSLIKGLFTNPSKVRSLIILFIPKVDDACRLH